MQLDTALLHAGVRRDPAYGAVSVPVYPSATFQHPAPGESTGYDYSRSGTPTRAALEEALARAEGGARALASSSGMAAVTCARAPRARRPSDRHRGPVRQAPVAGAGAGPAAHLRGHGGPGGGAGGPTGNPGHPGRVAHQPDDLIRFSAGIEETADLITDLEQALVHAAAPAGA